MNVQQNLCDSGLTKIVEDCKKNPINPQNTTFCNDLIEADTLYKNAKFYYSTNEYQGALVSYSCAAVLLNSASRQLSSNNLNPDVKTELDNILNCCLSAVEVLLEKTKKTSKSSDDEETKDWEKICVKIQPLVFRKKSSNCIFFSDVAGLYEEKKTFESSLIYPLMYPNLYPKRSKGILLYGPPGTGKTYIVKAAVNQLQLKGGNSVGVLFFAPSPGDLKGKYVGETEKRIEEIFTCASRAACNHEIDCKNGKKYISIIFMDEFDAIAPDRENDTTGLAANSVNTLLQMMDGINSKPNVAVIAATNFPWYLDAAILRRFDTQILVDIPKESDMLDLLNTEMKQMIQLKPNESEYSYCEIEKQKEEKSDLNKTEQLQCNIGCENTKTQELYLSAPYNKINIDYYKDSTSSEKGGFIKAMIKKMAIDNFSNSDISRMFKTAATNAGELCVKANLFYSARLIDYTLEEKYISCIAKMKDHDRGINESIKILNNFSSNSLNNNSDIYQLDKPNIVSIEYSGDIYYNTKCLLYKSNELIIDHPLIKDVYIKGNKSGIQITTQDYNNNILSNSVDIIIAFDFTFKETNVDLNEIPIVPVSQNLINNIFKPVFNGIKSIKKNAEDRNKFNTGNGNIWLKQTYNLTDPEDIKLLLSNDNKIFNINDKNQFINNYVKTILLNQNCDINSLISENVYKNFDFKFNNYDLMRYLLLFSGANDFAYYYTTSIIEKSSEKFKIESNFDTQQYSPITLTTLKGDTTTIMFNGKQFVIKFNDYKNTIQYYSKYQTNFTVDENKLTTSSIVIEKELFKILMRLVFKENELLKEIELISGIKETYLTFNKNDDKNIYYLSPGQVLIQILLNDIYSFMDLSNKFYIGETNKSKINATFELFNGYISNLSKLDTQDDAKRFFYIEQICCVRIFDNYNFAKNGIIINDVSSTKMGGGVKENITNIIGENRKKFKLSKKKKTKFNNKETKRNRINSNNLTKKNLRGSGILDKDISEDLDILEEVNEEDSTMKNEMFGGANAASYDGFIKFCNNNDSTEYNISKIANKTIFVATNYDLSEVKKLRKDGLLNDIWYEAPSYIKSFANYISSNNENKSIETEKILNEYKEKNQYLPFIFKSVKSIGFLQGRGQTNLTDDNNLLTDDKITTEIAWSVADQNTWKSMVTNIFKGIGQAVKGTVNVATFTSSDNLYNILSLIGFGLVEKGLYNQGDLSSYYNIAYLATIIGSNIYNFVTAENLTTNDILNKDNEYFNSITLSIILNTITDIRYIETDKFNNSANEIFSNAILEAINKLSILTVGTSMTGVPSTKLTTSDIKKYTEKYNFRDGIKEKLTNLNIPIKSFSYALTKVKSTYVKKTGEDLRLYKNNKDAFMEKLRKEKNK